MCSAAGAMASMTVGQGFMQMQANESQAAQMQAQGERANSVAQLNAQLMEKQARDVQKQGAQARLQHRVKGDNLIAKQKVSAAASGLSIESGSPLAIRIGTQETLDDEELMIAENFERRAMALRDQAALTRYSGETSLADSKFAEKQLGMTQFGTLLGATGNFMGTGVADKWFSAKSAAKSGGTA